jgi:hypothetical protein
LIGENIEYSANNTRILANPLPNLVNHLSDPAQR